MQVINNNFIIKAFFFFSLCHFKTFHHLCSAYNTMVVKLFHSAGHRSIARHHETGFFYAPSTVACNGLTSLGTHTPTADFIRN